MQHGELHKRCIVFDAHNDLLQGVLAGKRKMACRQSQGHSDIPRLLEGGVTAQVFALFVPTRELSAGPFRYTMHLLDAFFKELEEAGGQMLLATSPAHIRRAKEEGKLAAVLSIEGAEGIEEDLALLRILHRLGVRMVGLAWSRRNKAADGVSESGPDEGLTEFGRELVRELNRLGIIIDVSHLAPRGVAEVLELSEAPVVASHSNAYALCPHYRNLTDEQIKGIADKGGVVGVTFVPHFLTPGEEEASIEHLLDHIDHIVKVAGVEHVGLGSDFEGFHNSPPRGLEDATCYPHITAGLLRRGYDEEAVEKIMGGNFLRVFEEVTG